MAYFDQRGIEQIEAKGKQCFVKRKRKKEVDWTFNCIINMETTRYACMRENSG
jgi:hypothetical protein